MKKLTKPVELNLTLDNEYFEFLKNIKTRLKIAQLKAATVVNTELIIFYWRLGKDILKTQASKKHWGKKFLEQLAHDLQIENPGMSGFSKRNLEYMRLLATIYPEEKQFTQQPAITMGRHSITIR